MRIHTSILLLASMLWLVGVSKAQQPRDRMRPIWKLDSSELRSNHVLKIWALDDTTSNFENDKDTNVISILRDAKLNKHKHNSGIAAFELDSFSSIFNPSKFRIGLMPSFNDYTIQDTLVITIEMIDTSATAMFNLNIQDSAGNGLSRFIYLQATSTGPSVLSTHPLLRYYDLISPYWRLDTSELRSRHRFELVAIDDTLLRHDDTTQIAKAIRWQLSQSRSSHRGNSGLMELYPVQYYLGYDTSAFNITLSSWDGYTVQDSMRLTFQWLDTTATGFFRVMIADSSGQGLGTEPYFLISPNLAPLAILRSRAKGATNIYPNPATNYVRIENPERELLSVLDQYGKVVQPETETDQINVSLLSTGQYFIKKGDELHRLIVIK